MITRAFFRFDNTWCVLSRPDNKRMILNFNRLKIFLSLIRQLIRVSSSVVAMFFLGLPLKSPSIGPKKALH